MSYIKKEITETITHEKSVGMLCDSCSSKTDNANDPAWFGFYTRTFFYNSDENDSEYRTVCDPKCFLKLMAEFVSETEDDNDDFKFADMNLDFAKKFIKYNN